MTFIINKLNQTIHRKKLIDYGHYSFLIGIFFLASALPISILFLLISLIISFKLTFKNILKDKFNYYLLCISILMVISYLYTSYISTNDNTFNAIIIDSWIDLFNWIPLFLSFYGFQIYLSNVQNRILFGKALVISTFPVIVSCINQYWFNIFGPFTTLNGLIVWYQKPFENINSGVTGLFSNPNYAGYWLATIIPFIFYFYVNKKKVSSKLIILFILLLSSYLLIHTGSRNSLLSLIISSIIIFSSKWIFLIISALIIFLILYYLLKGYLPIFIVNTVELFIPKSLSNKFLLFKTIGIQNFHRFDTYKNALYYIFKKPLFGWGASTFGILYAINSGISPATHSHNILLEIAYNYGIIVSIIFTYFIFLLISKTWIIIKMNKVNLYSSIDKYWLTASLTSLIFHLNDIPYYDGKVSIIFWVLLSGLRSIIRENEYKLDKADIK